MIIQQTTTIIFEYPQDYLQEQEWCKTKDDRWVHKGMDTRCSIYENTISYSIGASADCKDEPLPTAINGIQIASAVAWADKWLEDNPVSEMWDMIRTLRDATEWQDEPQTEREGE